MQEAGDGVRVIESEDVIMGGEDGSVGPQEVPRAKVVKSKVQYERPVVSGQANAMDAVLNRVNQLQIPLSLGELFTISPALAEKQKKHLTRRRVSTGEVEYICENAEKFGEDVDTHFSAPLGYLVVTLNGKERKALVDSGSQINLISLEQATSIGLPIKSGTGGNLRGIGGHATELMGYS
ncbi:retropepsin-like aspartic protease [Xanthomonas sp. A2111]|uniref:Retropepsin-like aspartic protease n=1 Tax=Xanthomonas hawaiiensis TaxID=3003247 RepID=A0ABU2IAK8_9XANT|nr:retropepsin-like aspartic protease [Xanthomonas sp. A2111]MDS9995186.1 retropepsin-like aspartic protease [Xanthomonas sp. A2111]